MIKTLAKQRQKSYKKFVKFNKRMIKYFGKAIKHLQKAKDKYTVSHWFSNAYNLTEYADVNYNPIAILHKYNVHEGENLIDTYKYDLRTIESIEAFGLKPTKKANISPKSINILERNFSFVDSYYPLKYHWFKVNNNHVTLLDEYTAIKITKIFKDDLVRNLKE